MRRRMNSGMTGGSYKDGVGLTGGELLLRAQRDTLILKDLDRPQRTAANHRIMFITDTDVPDIPRPDLCRAPDIEIVDLVTRRGSRAEPTAQHCTWRAISDDRLDAMVVGQVAQGDSSGSIRAHQRRSVCANFAWF